MTENILRLGEQEAKRNGTGINPYCALIEEACSKQLIGVIIKLFFLKVLSGLLFTPVISKLIQKISPINI